MKENNEKKMKNENEISKLIKAFPKDIAALDKRSVLAKGRIQIRCNEMLQNEMKNKNDKKVIPDPIDERKFQE